MTREEKLFVEGMKKAQIFRSESDSINEVLDKIRAEIETEIEWAKEHGCDEWLSAFGLCLEIIDRHISGKE